MATKTSKTPLIRLAHQMAFSAFLHDIGAPVDRYMRQQGLPVLNNDPNAYVPLLKVWSFFKSAARHEDPNLGWHAGTFVGDHNLNGNLLLQLESAPTLLEALRRLVRMVRAEASDIDLGIRVRQDDILFYSHYSDLKQSPGYMNAQAYQLSIVFDLIRYFLGPDWVPNEVGIESSVAPPVAEEIFPDARILIQQQTGYIAVPKFSLHRAAYRGDVKGSGADIPVQRGSFEYMGTLRALLGSYLSEGYPTQRFAAELMNTSVRTLTRRLSTNHGLTYGTLIDELRFGKAKENLQNPDMSVMDVARSVGFNDQGDFARMFCRIGGLSPTEFRKTLQE